MKWTCKHCNNEFDFEKPQQKANHSRWCDSNPKKQKYISDLKERDTIALMNKAKEISGKTNQFSKAKLEGSEINHVLKGKKHPNPFKTHTEESRSKISKAALNSKHRRLRKNTIEYNGVLLDSTWELELAKRLDALDVKWERPDPLKWIDNSGITRNYFPDFYLLDYDVYLDPKNPHAYKVQSNKIDILNNTYSNIVWILSLQECKTYIPS